MVKIVKLTNILLQRNLYTICYNMIKLAKVYNSFLFSISKFINIIGN